MIGKTVSHYRIESRLGEGGMGVVYSAEDLRLGRKVALKFLSPGTSEDPQAIKRLQREARAASALSHPNICTIFEVDEYEGQPFLAMELLEGQSLAKRIAGHPVQNEQLLEWSIQIADALESAHHRGVIHRDIKPGNIFITSRGQAKVLDFGLAKWAPRDPLTLANAPTAAYGKSDEPTTGTGLIIGTMAYMSPEQVRGEDVDTRSDIFSLGIVLYEMSTGRQAFSGTTSAVICEAILNKTPSSPVRLNPELPAGYEAIVNKALEKNREMRYQSAADLRTDLARVKRDSSQKSINISGHASELRWLKRLAIVSGTLLLLGLAAIALFLLRKPPSKPIDSLAVLPFSTSDESTGFVNDFLAIQITNDLARIPGLHVVPRTAVSRWKGQEQSAQKVGQELNVRGVLSGKMKVLGGDYNFQVELVNADSGMQVWGNQYSGHLNEIKALPEEIVKDISEELKMSMTKEDWARVSKGSSEFALLGELSRVGSGPSSGGSSISRLRPSVSNSTFYGTYYDLNGNPGADVEVTLESRANGFNRRTVTRHDGSYVFERVPPGFDYFLVASKQGRVLDNRTGVVIKEGEETIMLPPLKEQRQQP